MESTSVLLDFMPCIVKEKSFVYMGGMKSKRDMVLSGVYKYLLSGHRKDHIECSVRRDNCS